MKNINTIILAIIGLTVSGSSIFAGQTKTLSPEARLEAIPAGQTLVAPSSPTESSSSSLALSEVALGNLVTTPTLIIPTLANINKGLVRRCLDRCFARTTEKLKRYEAFIKKAPGLAFTTASRIFTSASDISFLNFAIAEKDLISNGAYYAEAICSTICNITALAGWLWNLDRSQPLMAQIKKAIREATTLELVINLSTLLGQAVSIAQLIDWANGTDKTPQDLYTVNAAISTLLNFVVISLWTAELIKEYVQKSRAAAFEKEKAAQQAREEEQKEEVAVTTVSTEVAVELA